MFENSISDDKAFDDQNRRKLQQQVRKFGWLYHMRPQSLVEPLYRLLRRDVGRAIIDVDGTRLFIDPFTTHGMEIVVGDGYESALIDLIHSRLPRGGVFVDVGANEGLLSAVAARITGSDGLIIAIEPQDRLRDIIEINLSLNASYPFRVISAACAEQDDKNLTLNLGPSSHSGGSSLVRAYRWSKNTQRVVGRSLDRLLSSIGDRQIDLLKIDVEGYECEVIRSARYSLAKRKIKVLAVDFHGSILKSRGINSIVVDAELISYGYKRELGDGISGYSVYAL